MKLLISKLGRIGLMLTLVLAYLLPGATYAKGIDEEPSGGAMVADAVVARPLFLATTVIGASLYVVTLPISLLGGNVEQAGETLVVKPARNTFVRCLGCKQTGYQE